MPVKLILKEDVENLGKTGDVVNVKAGYARNYLLPRSIALLATTKNLLNLKQHREELQKEAEKKKAEYEEIKKKIEDLGKLEIKAKIGPTAKLFGRITSNDISEVLNEKFNISINHRNIKIEGYSHGVDELGEYKTKIFIGANVYANIQLYVQENI